MKEALAFLGPIEERTLADMVTARMRDAIIQGEVPPGQRLTEPELADSLNVSRSPVREALARLRSEGLVVGSSATYVWRPSQSEVDEVFSLRTALDSLAMEWIISENRLADKDFDRLQSLVDEWQAQVDKRNVVSLSANAVIAADESFIGNLYRRSGHALVMRIWRQTISQWRLLMHHYLAHNDILRIAANIASVHQTILDALERKDLEATKVALETVNDRRSVAIKASLQ